MTPKLTLYEFDPEHARIEAEYQAGLERTRLAREAERRQRVRHWAEKAAPRWVAWIGASFRKVVGR